MIEEPEFFSNATVIGTLNTDMNTTTGDTNMTVTSNTDMNTTTRNQTNTRLHPGLTTIISFSVAIFLVLTYLYCENLLNCLQRICRHWNINTKQRSKVTTNPTGIVTANSTKTSETNVMEKGTSSKKYQDNSSPIIWDSVESEPVILCKCGQIHKLNDNKKFNKQYRPLRQTNMETTNMPKYVVSSNAVTLKNPNVNFNHSEVTYDSETSFRGLTEKNRKVWSELRRDANGKTPPNAHQKTISAEASNTIAVPNVFTETIKPGVP